MISGGRCRDDGRGRPALAVPASFSMTQISCPIASHIALATLGEDVILLDVAADAYACMPMASGLFTIEAGRAHGPPEVITALIKAGVLDPEAEPENRKPLPKTPVKALEVGVCSPLSPLDVLAFWRAALRAPKADVEIQMRLSAGPASPRGMIMSMDRIAQLTSVFKAWLPWSPAQGACLHRAWVLRALLRQRGQDADWVFGVRTWPFSAHCWLQVGDAVLDDDPDRVALYTPILAV